MERTDIHKEQIEELEKLNAQQIIFDLEGIIHLLELKAFSQETDSKVSNEEHSAGFLLTNALRTHTASLRTYFETLGEV